MSDLRVLTFTVQQMRELLFAAAFRAPPTSAAGYKRQLDIMLDHEWHRQQYEKEGKGNE